MKIYGYDVDEREIMNRLLGELPNEGLCGDPKGDEILSPYAEIVHTMCREGKTEFNDDEYESVLEFLVSNPVTDGEWINEELRERYMST